jgi:hypothetical protein
MPLVDQKNITRKAFVLPKERWEDTVTRKHTLDGLSLRDNLILEPHVDWDKDVIQ